MTRLSPEFYRQRGEEGRPYILHYLATGDEGYVPPQRPWVRAPKPERCGHCGTDGRMNLVRIRPSNGDKGDGWACIPCGWTLYDPGCIEDLNVPEGRRRK